MSETELIDSIKMLEKAMTQVKEELNYLLNTHHELTKACLKNNNGLQEMNLLIRGLIDVLRTQDD